MADGKIKDSEMAFIQKLSQRIAISDRELIELFENPKTSRPVFNEVERITHFYKLILLMNIDSEAHPAEIEALKNFGLKMGVRPLVADQIMKKIETSPERLVSAEELLNIFKIYYN